MIEPIPPGVTVFDWENTPDAVRALLAQSIKRLGQMEDHSSFSDLSIELPTEEVNPQSGYILVVDDNDMNRDMLSRRLEKQGHRVQVAVNGRQALDMLRREAFDVVLLDIMMPEMNGYEVLETMNNDNALAHIPVIMITAVDDIDSIVRCIQLGAEDYLPKPFNPVLLKARIGASLEKKQLRDRQKAYMQQLDLENQRKSAELEQARQIQLSMLPASSPDLPYLDIAASQQTASEVGGDYYEFFPLPDNRLRVVIGDATGHGVASGLMVSMTKASLLASDETALMPLIEKINTVLSRIDLGTQLNMALLLLEISPRQNGLVAVRASGGGMPPIYILRQDGPMEEIIISGLPFGVTEQAAYQPTEFSLGSGDVILLTSDGLSERFNHQGQMLGYDRLTVALSQLPTTETTAGQILVQTARIGNEWAKGHPLHDDVTLVVIRVL